MQVLLISKCNNIEHFVRKQLAVNKQVYDEKSKGNNTRVWAKNCL